MEANFEEAIDAGLGSFELCPFGRPCNECRSSLEADWQILKEICSEDPMFCELQSSLFDVEREYRGMSRRVGIYEALEDRFKACQYESEQETLLGQTG